MLASSLGAAGRLPGATERVDPSQQRRSLEAGAVSELQGIARFRFHEGKLEDMVLMTGR
jgi:hypothetical protein